MVIDDPHTRDSSFTRVSRGRGVEPNPIPVGVVGGLALWLMVDPTSILTS